MTTAGSHLLYHHHQLHHQPSQLASIKESSPQQSLP
jgi:hypothetical protein